MYVIAFSDVHAILPALQALEEELQQLSQDNIDVDRLWFLGDVLGYGPYPIDVISKMHDLFADNPNNIALLGNHDQAILDQLGKPLIENTPFKPHGAAHIKKHAEILEKNDQYAQWLKSLEPQAIAIEDTGYLLAHGQFMWGEAKNNRYRLWTYGTESKTKRSIQIHKIIHDNPSEAPVRLIMNGHYHVAGLWRMTIQETSIDEDDLITSCIGQWQEFDNLSDAPLIINVGSISLPRDAGHLQCATYVLIDIDEENYDKIRIQFRTLRYKTEEMLHRTEGPMTIGYEGLGILRQQIERAQNCSLNNEKGY